MAQQQGEVIYHNDFNSRSEMAGWDGKYKLVTKDGNSALRVTSRHKLFVDLPTDKVKGATLKVKTRVKAQKVSTPPNPWNGIKVMLHSTLPWADDNPQMSLPSGSFEWRQDSFLVIISRDVDTLELVLGLENVKGRVWYDYVDVSILEPAAPLLQADPAAPVYKGHNEERLRGMMISTFASADDLRTLASWGANHVRWQLSWEGFPSPNADTASVTSYKEWLNTALTHVDSLLPLCRQLGIHVLLDLHSIPGGRAEGMIYRVFREKEWQQAMRDIWKQIALRYKDEPAIWGYDLANEPIEGLVPAGLMNWQQLSEAIAKDINEIDSKHAIIIEAAPAGNPESLEHFKPVAAANVVYSFHMYHPLIFTGQAIGDTTEFVRYPGIINGKEWNKATLRRLLQGVKNWQNAYGAHIYIGEFSAVRWAPNESAYYYLRDCIEVFEEFGWDWAYHAFREYQAWSVEHSNKRSDTAPSAKPTLRKELFLEWFGRNRR